MCRGDKLGHREGTPQPSCLRRPGPALGPCHPLHPATGTGDALWRTVRVHGPCLHAEHNMGLQGAGAEAGWKPILDAVGLQTGCCRPSKETHSPWTPVTRQGSWASALPFWLETGPAQTPLVMQRKASRGQHVAPGRSSPGLGKLSKVTKNRRNKANTQQLCAGSACGLLESLGQDAVSLHQLDAVRTPSFENRRCPSKDARTHRVNTARGARAVGQGSDEDIPASTPADRELTFRAGVPGMGFPL